MSLNRSFRGETPNRAQAGVPEKRHIWRSLSTKQYTHPTPPTFSQGAKEGGMGRRDSVFSLSAEIAGAMTPGLLARGINLALDDPVKDA